MKNIGRNVKENHSDKIYNTKSPRLMKTISSLYSITQKPILIIPYISIPISN